MRFNRDVTSKKEEKNRNCKRSGREEERDRIIDVDLCNRYGEDWFFVVHREIGRGFLSPF